VGTKIVFFAQIQRQWRKFPIEDQAVPLKNPKWNYKDDHKNWERNNFYIAF
jgi:hypothetical protein